MREAPASMIAAVQEVLGCRRAADGLGDYCGEHPALRDGWRARGCEVAADAADAAWAAAYPEALRDAGERLDALTARFADGSNAYVTAYTLRRWADESEAAK